MKTRLLMNSVSALSMATFVCALGGSAFAQSAAPADTIDTVSVTGTLITANGYQTPTPVTTLTTDDLLENTPTSIPDALEQLPQFTNTASTTNYGASGSVPGAGNYLNLRGLGAIENLTMMDGVRLPATSFNGTVDANIIPQAFVSRVDVVTGGASAAYGSDAVSGVINFIINKNFNGLKGSIQGGVSTFDDGAQLKLSIAGGMSLLGGHIEASYDHFQQPGILCVRLAAGDCNRPNAYGYTLTGAGSSAATAYVVTANTHENNITYGTLITSATASTATGSGTKSVPTFTYLNYQFSPTGQAIPFNAGTPTGTSNFNSGGDGAVLYGTSLTAGQVSDQGYLRYDHDLTSDISAYASLSYTQSKNNYITVADGNQVNSFHIFQDNAYLPTSVAQAMAAQNVAYLTGSRANGDGPPKYDLTLNMVYLAQAGLKGKIFGNWDWSADYAHGDSQLRTDVTGQIDFSKWYPALDAVRAPDGSIACRITLTNPSADPGCVPLDPFGQNSPSTAADAEVYGVAKYQVENRTDNLTFHLSGGLFDLPAGTVNFAAGAEYRYQQLKETSNTNPADLVNQTGFCHAVGTNGAPTGAAVTSAQCNASPLAPGIVNVTTTASLAQYSTVNVGPSAGHESIGQGYAELAIPILNNMPFVEDLDTDIAYRFAQYSVSGSAQTWKIGASYVPIDELRIRGSVSRDFRAPTLYELFGGETAGFGNFNDGVHTGLSQPIESFSGGNASLKPEVGNTSTVGVVWTPSYIDGFSGSLDYYTVRITNMISSVSTATSDQLCEQSGGTDPLCANIVRPFPFSDHTADNFPLYTISEPYNQASTSLTGFDLDATYNFDLNKIFSDVTSSLRFRFIGDYRPSMISFTGLGGTTTEGAGAGSSPKVKFNVTGDYIDGPLDVGGRIRYIGEDRYTNNPAVFYSYNGGVEAQPVAYFDLNASYRFDYEGHQFTAYGSINNLLNAFVFVPGTGLPNEFYTTNQALYDIVGRYFTFGVRFNY